MDNAQQPSTNIAQDAAAPHIIGIPATIARRFVENWSEELAADLAANLNCRETDALADLLRAFDAHEAAAVWIDAHAEGDGEDDEHVSWLDGKDAYRWRPEKLPAGGQA